ncbi:variant SH3 domain-containing protein [Phthorimaea operculella]|nr:variant SH3 domain-containing protein [Phthorimaea operculella]
MGDPWMIQPHEHAKFAEHFRNLGPVNGHLTGEQAKRFMLQSQLPPPVLGQIWTLADTDSDGKLDLKEFSIACKIINLKLHGIEVPKVLPPSLLGSLSPAGPPKQQFAAPAKPPIPPMPSIPPQPSQTTTNLLGDFNQPPTAPIIPPAKPAVPDLISGVKPLTQPITTQPLMGSNALIGGVQPAPLIGQPAAPLIPGVPPLASQPLIGGPAPLAAKPLVPGVPPQPMIPPQPMMGTQPLIGGLPAAGTTQPLIGTTQPLIGTSQPLIGTSQPLIGATQPLTGTTQPLMGATQPLIGPSQPLGTTQPLIGTTQPLIGATQPLISTSQPLIGANQPLTGTTQPLTGTTQPLTGPTQPLTGTTQPLIGTSDLPGPAPIIPPSQPSTRAGSLTGSLISPTSTAAVPGSIPQPVTSTPITALKSEVLSKPGSLATSPTDMAMGVVSPPPSAEWAVPQAQKLKYTQLFNATDRAKSGAVSGAQARSIMLQSRLPQQALAQIWALSDLDSDGKLGCEEFVLAMYLCEKATQGEAVPAKLPPELIPPSFRRDSVTSTGSNKSYEDRRRENMARGQAELERRRSQLADAQMKEKAERERKEREEAEKREKIRLEQQKREQEELARKQKEEQEKREAARKEMERQCQLEWEKKRTRELETMRTEEQSKVLALKSKTQSISVELNAATSRASALAVNIRETRTAVASAKCTIDGMRSDRDTSMAEMQQLKARVKELNAKQIALNKEKAELDAKAKASEGAGEDGKLNMMEVTLKQLRDKVEAAKAVVESKSADLDTNKTQLSELTAKVTELSEKCQRVWQLYEQKRQEYVERKSTAPAEAAWGAAEADWGTSNDAWGPSEPAEEAWGDAPAATAVEPVSSAATGAGAKWRCVYEFTARAPDELTLQPGDLVYEAPAPRTDSEPGWKWGTARGASGWFPEAYVEDISLSSTAYAAEVIEPIAKTQLQGIAEVPEAEITNDLGGAMPVVEGGDFYIAAYPYASPEPGDLNFEAGERIEVIRRDGDWWTGRIGIRTGIFPSNYVTKDATTEAAASDAIPTIPEANEPEVVPEVKQPAYEPAAPMSPPAQEQKSSTPISSEVAAITDSANGAAPSPATRPGSVARRDSGRDSALGRRKNEIAQAIANYTATSAEQLSLTKGQLLVVRKKADSGWWEGELQAKGRNRQVGWFPASYVKVMYLWLSPYSPKTRYQSFFADRYIYNFRICPVEPVGSILITPELDQGCKGQLLVVRKKADSGWWEGELQAKGRNRQVGWFPASYVKVIHSTLENCQTGCKGQLLVVRKKADSGWWEGELQAKGRNRQVGWFPASYVKGVRGSYIKVIQDVNRVLYSGCKGQLLVVRKKADSGWWEGELQAKGRNRQVGWFPASYVKVMYLWLSPYSPKTRYQSFFADRYIYNFRICPVGPVGSILTTPELDQGGKGQLHQGKYRMLYSGCKDQLLVVRKKADSGWWEGELQAKGRNRQVGWFPASYVKILQSSGRTSGRTTPVLSKMDTMPAETVIDKVIALYPYTAQNADELSFEKDDIIAVTDRSQDPAWWQGMVIIPDLCYGKII